MMKIKKLNSMLLGLFGILTLSVALLLVSFNGNNKVIASETNDSEITDITATVSGGKLVLNVTDTESSSYQFWMKRPITVHQIDKDEVNGIDKDITENYNAWVLVQGFEPYAAEGVSVSDYENYQIDGYYYILVRIKNGTELTEIYKTISVSSTNACITSVMFGSQSLTDVNYLQVGNIDVTVTGNMLATQGFTITDSKGTYSSVNGVISYPVKEGLYNAVIKAIGGESQNIVIKGYKCYDNYTKITGILIGGGTNFGENIPINSDSTTLQVNTETVGSGSNVTAKLSIAGNTVNLPIVNEPVPLSFSTYGLGYGVYQFTVSLVNNETGLVEDYYTGYYNYSRATVPSMTVDEPVNNGNGSYTLNVSSTSNFGNNIVYQFVKWDVKGEYVIADWRSVGNLEIILSRNGIYRFEVRAKSEGASSWELRKFIDLTVGTPDPITERTITITEYSNDKTASYVKAQTPYIVSVTEDLDATQYKFIVTGKGQWDVEQYYSPTNSFIWIPKKSGYYTVQVRINNNGSYGYADSIYTKEINVRDISSLEEMGAYLFADFELEPDGSYFGAKGATPLKYNNDAVVELSDELASSGKYSLKIVDVNSSWAGLTYADEVIVESFDSLIFTLNSSEAKSDFQFSFNNGSWVDSSKVAISQGVGTYCVKLPQAIDRFTEFLVSTKGNVTYYFDDIFFATAYVHEEDVLLDFEFDGKEMHFVSGGTIAPLTGTALITDEWSVGEGSKYSLKVVCASDSWLNIIFPSSTQKLFDTISFDMKTTMNINSFEFEVRTGGSWKTLTANVTAGVGHYEATFPALHAEYDALSFKVHYSYGTYYLDNIKLSNSKDLGDFERTPGAVADFEPNGDILNFGINHDGFHFNGDNYVARESISSDWASDGFFSFKVACTGDGWAGITTTTDITVPEFNTVSFDIKTSKAISGWSFELRVGNNWKPFTVNLVEGVNHVTYTYDETFTQYNGFDCRAIYTYGTYYIDKIVLSMV